MNKSHATFCWLDEPLLKFVDISEVKKSFTVFPFLPSKITRVLLLEYDKNRRQENFLIYEKKIVYFLSHSNSARAFVIHMKKSLQANLKAS